jgi:hypothetical protein
MVDKNGKLFGKINLIDLIIILVIVAVLAFVALRVTGVVGGGQAKAESVVISFFADEAPDYVIDYIHEGDPIRDFNEEVGLGKVTSFEAGESIAYEASILGTQDTQLVRKEGYSSVAITALAEGVLGDNGVTIGGELYGVGHTLTISVGRAKIYAKVSGIEPAA